MVHDIRIVTEAELRRAVTMDLDTVEVVERAFAALATGGVSMPPTLSMPFAGGEGAVDVETALIDGLQSYAVKILSGLRDTPDLRRPGRDGLVVQFSAETGAVEAVFLDNGYLTDLRTAAAGAVAARYLAPEDVTTAGVIGAGPQASLQIKAARLVRSFERVLVYGRNPHNAAACAADLAASLDVEVEVTTDPEVLVKRSQLVVTATSEQAPVLKAAWLHKELHVTAVGTDQLNRNEIEAAGLVRADLYVCDRVDQCATAGELRAAREAGLFTDEAPPELGDIVTGRRPGRRSPAEITICDLAGTGAQDTAIAAHAADLISETGTVIRA
ncbi:MAG TPA: ornithine cyclodeaminase family protein [Rhodobacteraceae bacterium]|nr:ornithine cyclodeaminase family protein [Paracoccaceae bacterium]